MPKMKTHSGAKKRFKVTATGKVRGRHPFTSHILEKKPPKKKRALGGPKIINDHDVPRIKRMLGQGARRATSHSSRSIIETGGGRAPAKDDS